MKKNIQVGAVFKLMVRKLAVHSVGNLSETLTLSDCDSYLDVENRLQPQAVYFSMFML